MRIADFRLKNARYEYDDKGQYKAKGIDIADCRIKIEEYVPTKKSGSITVIDRTMTVMIKSTERPAEGIEPRAKGYRENGSQQTPCALHHAP